VVRLLGREGCSRNCDLDECLRISERRDLRITANETKKCNEW